jgi:hypothetical protein
VATAGGTISLIATGAISSNANGTINANGSSGAGGNILIKSTAGSVSLGAAVSATSTNGHTGGNITVQGSGTVTTNAGAIISSAAADATSSGGEILIRSVAGDVNLGGAVNGNGGTTNGNGAVITISADAGTVKVSAVNASKAGAGTAGLVQINSGSASATSVTQYAGTVLTADNQKLITVGTVNLPQANLVGNLAADLSGGTGSLTYNNAINLTVTTVSANATEGTLGLGLPQVVGIKTVGASILVTVTGTLTANQPVSSDPPAVAGGTIELKAGGDIISTTSGKVISTSTLGAGNGGEIFFWSTGGQINLHGDVNADGGTSGNGGTITFLTGGVAGSINVGNVSSLCGGTHGTVQFSATGGITQDVA